MAAEDRSAKTIVCRQQEQLLSKFRSALDKATVEFNAFVDRLAVEITRICGNRQDSLERLLRNDDKQED